MSKTLLLLLLLVLCAPFSGLTAGKRPDSVWSYYHFDGAAFSSGPAVDGGVSVAVREQMQPVFVTAPTAAIEPVALPDGAGAVAGICYTQSAGGKLAGNTGFRPHPRMPLMITSGYRQPVTIQADDQGYFTAVLAAGTYSVGSGGFTSEITVKRGLTTLVPFRGGKRMVD